MNEEKTGRGHKSVRRRDVWRHLLGSVVMMRDELRGIAHMPISGLADLPDTVLAEMVPQWRDGGAPVIREDGLYRASAEGAQERAYTFGDWEKLMVDQYAGGRNLQAIAAVVSEQSGMTQEQAFALTRELFVRLCRQGWCHPAAAHT